MYSQEDIARFADLVKDTVNLSCSARGLSVDKVFLIGSYAATLATDNSDIDFLVQFSGGKLHYDWADIVWVHRMLPKHIHVIFGTEEAQRGLSKPYRLVLGG